MNPREVSYEEDGRRVRAGWLCAKCGAFWMTSTFGDESERKAVECCGTATCHECNAPMEHRWHLCDACRRKADAATDRAYFAKAEKVTLDAYDGTMLYVEGASNDGYVSKDDVEDELSSMLATGKPIPEWGWGTVRVTADFPIDDALRAYLDDEHHDGAHDDVDWTLIEHAQKLVNEATKDVVSYFFEHDVAVLLPPAKPRTQVAG